MMFSSLFSIAAMMLILGLFLILAVNVSLLAQSARDQFDMVEIYLEDTADDDTRRELTAELKKQPCVESVSYVSKDMALRIMKKRWGDHGYLLDGLSDNPLPASLRVKLKEIGRSGELVRFAKEQDGVEDVLYRREEINKILKITNGVRIGAVVLILFLTVICVVAVANTIKLTVLARGRAITIMKYVGATNWFIRGPFLMEGVVMGMISALFSVFVISGLYIFLEENYAEKILVMFSIRMVPVSFLITRAAVLFLAIGITIGAAGSLISMKKFLDT